MMQEFFTARELADLSKARGLKSFPGSERGVRVLAEREGWNALPARLCRRRAGRAGGGGLEYHLSVLPGEMQALLASRAVRDRLAVAHHETSLAERRQIEALRAQSLPARAKAVMEARAAILTAIEGYAVAHGEDRAWGIACFIDAQSSWDRRQKIEAARDAGQPLTPREAEELGQPLLLTTPAGFDLPVLIMATANDRLKSGSTISERTIFRWFSARADRGVAGLAPTTTKEAQPVPPGFMDFMKFYAIGSKPTASDALGEYLKTNPPVERRLTIEQVRHVLRVKLNNIEKNIGREGILTLRSRMAYITRTTDDLWPTTIYSADGKTFDAEVADPVSGRPMRPELTTIIDVATRKVVGWATSRKENVIAVTEALRKSCVGHGIPAIFYVDRGPGYKNKTFDADVLGLMGRLGIAKMHAAPYNSQGKGLIERPNATIWDTLAKRMPTYIGEDMDKEAGKKVHLQTRRDIVQFGHSRLLPTWEEFIRLCADRIAEYNATPHRGLPRFEDPETGRMRHMSPDEAWAAHVSNGFEAVPVSPEELDDLFRPYEIRVARRSLIQWNGNEYFHAALENYHERQVMVGYDYDQADKVWVREFDVESGQPGRLICVAIFGGNRQRYVPLTYQRAAEEQRAKARKKRLERHIADVEAEISAPFLLEQEAIAPAPFLDIVPEPVPAAAVALVVDNQSPEVAPDRPRRRVFASDEELAIWALAHPDELTPNQIRVLRGCVNSPAHRELFRMSGIDVEALGTLLRAVA